MISTDPLDEEKVVVVVAVAEVKTVLLLLLLLLLLLHLDETTHGVSKSVTSCVARSPILSAKRSAKDGGRVI